MNETIHNSTDCNQEPENSTLNSRISELENQYAELFLHYGDPVLLKSIHLELERLKRPVGPAVPHDEKRPL